MIEYTVGRDISKFFYGGYALDGNTNDPKLPNNRHAHSNVARKIVLRHVVAVIGKKDTQTNKFQIDHSQTIDVNKFTKTLILKAFIPNKINQGISGL